SKALFLQKFLAKWSSLVQGLEYPCNHVAHALRLRRRTRSEDECADTFSSSSRRHRSRPSDEGRERPARRGRPRPGHLPVDLHAPGGPFATVAAPPGGAPYTRGQPRDVSRPRP